MVKPGVTAPLGGLFVLGCASRTRGQVVSDPPITAEIAAPEGFGK